LGRAGECGALPDSAHWLGMAIPEEERPRTACSGRAPVKPGVGRKRNRPPETLCPHSGREVATVKPSSTLDVSHLPTVAFGSRDPLWWGGMGLLIIEAVFFSIGLVSYVYLRALASAWPPPPTPKPDLLIPTVNTLLLLVSVVPIWWVDRAARRLEQRAVRLGLVLCVIFGLVCSGLRVCEFHALHTRWDSHVYGSVAWTLLGLHTFDWVAEVVEIMVMTVQACMEPMTQYRFLDISDSAPFWHFIVAIWLPLYAVLYVVPHIL